jgi:tellurite resistance protein TerC
MTHQILLWVGFNIFVLFMLTLDLGLFHRQAHEIKVKEALGWSAFWIALALLFNALIYFWHGSESALAFLTGYLLEKSLSVDNIFVFLMIFSYFSIPGIHQHKVLFWGILGALVMRATFIATGVTLIHQFEWVIYIFGLLLIVTGVKMALQKEDREIQPEKNPVLKLFKRYMPVTNQLAGSQFFLKQGGFYVATPLFVVLLIVETTDLVFALDSIPAVLGVTQDGFIVYTSNVFAILGLRALYFALAGVMQMFQYLHYGLSAILVFVGAKMLLADLYEIPIGIALGIVATILAISVVASLLFPSPGEKVEFESSEPIDIYGPNKTAI